MRRPINQWPEWPNARDWIGIGTFALTIMILWMVKADPSLRRDEFFKTIATLIIGTGFINGVVSWAYGATKGGGELADKNAEIVKQAVEAPAEPVKAEIVNDAASPVPTTEAEAKKK